ncbi:protein-L-isoaspartate O-methyltransferase family protein [Methylocystis heyeri]|uniref:Protein-L-isoaspartate O-methyltransferase n=1 Tax=Methylocystis heyeri TaxID=391905 RepID=A0A6B8KAF4_9HYPH|nr:protein-L-isoaspartate O-methyltransferase [Methylocystis heyeri]QGM45076.1 methyltransferase domain-containing protein [Methylocystis heyeri]
MALAATDHVAPESGVAGPKAANDLGKATAHLRRTMVERQLRPYDVVDLPVLNRFLEVPREVFLPPALEAVAYSDLAIPAKGDSGAASRAMPAPLVLARFLQVAEIQPGHRVLDVAGGTGYPAALLSGLAADVTALESEAELVAQARKNLDEVGATGVRLECGPLEKGVPGAAPFDVILVHGAVEANLDDLLRQLTPNGRLIAYMRLAGGGGMKVVAFERSEGNAAGVRPLFDAAAPVLPAFARAPAFVF